MTEQGTALAPRRAAALVSPSEWEMMKEQAKYLLAAEFFGGMDKYKALAIIEYGRELGYGPFYTLQNVNIIQGKPACSSQMFLSMAQRTGGEIRYLNAESDDTVGVVIYKRASWPDWERLSFTIDQAKALGLTGKDNWKKQPKTMLKWRAIGDAARTAFADALSGMYLAEELGADYEITPNGDMVLRNTVVGTPITREAVANTSTGETIEYEDAEFTVTPSTEVKASENVSGDPDRTQALMEMGEANAALGQAWKSDGKKVLRKAVQALGFSASNTADLSLDEIAAITNWSRTQLALQQNGAHEPATESVEEEIVI